jgi:FtsH ternary system domain X6
MSYGDVALVAQSEHDLLTIARALVGEVNPAAVSSLLRAPRALPPKIGPTAMGILKQTLSRGVVRELARRGGWQKSRMGAEGRLWERHRPIALKFSPITIEILRWLSSAPLGQPGSSSPPAAWRWAMADATLADELMLYLAADLLDQAEAGAADFALVARSPLSWLGFAGRLVRAGHSPPPMVFERWVQGDGAVIFEALGPELGRRWVTMEHSKRAIVAIAEMTALGAAQGAALEALFTAVGRAGRRDLVSFVVDAGAALLDPGAAAGDVRPPSGWYPSIRIASALVKNLAPTGPMRDRAAAWRAAGALLRALGQVKRWDAEHRTRRFFDDDYESAQRLLARWEALGTSGFSHAERILKELESLDASITETPKQGSKS